jgi:hypothetical protein
MRRGRNPGENEVAAKFDGKHARANMWVTHQNLARAKGGRPGYQFQERKAPRAPKLAPRPTAPATEPSAAVTDVADVADVASVPRDR